MTKPEILWDVYETPKLDAVAFGKYRAADDAGRPGILRAAKYNRRGHRASASNARGAIRDYLTSPFPNKGILDAHLEDYKKRLTDDSRSDEQHDNDKANHRNMKSFLNHWSQNQFGSKLITDIDEEQPPLMVGGMAVKLELDCIIQSTSKSNVQRVGGLFLNTQKGEGLGTRPETIAKRDKAGETVALLVLKAIEERFAGNQTVFPKDCIHYYVSQNKQWLAPASFAKKVKDVDACGKIAANQWIGIDPPSAFDPLKAKFHS